MIRMEKSVRHKLVKNNSTSYFSGMAALANGSTSRRFSSRKIAKTPAQMSQMMIAFSRDEALGCARGRQSDIDRPVSVIQFLNVAYLIDNGANVLFLDYCKILKTLDI